MSVGGNLGAALLEGVHELRHRVGDETDEDGEDDEAEEEDDEVQPAKAELVGDIGVVAGGDDELQTEEDGVVHVGGSENFGVAGDALGDLVPTDAEHGEAGGGAQGEELEGVVGVGRDAVLHDVPYSVAPRQVREIILRGATGGALHLLGHDAGPVHPERLSRGRGRLIGRHLMIRHAARSADRIEPNPAPSARPPRARRCATARELP